MIQGPGLGGGNGQAQRPRRPAPRSLWTAPFAWFDWCLEWLVYWISGWAVIQVLQFVAVFATAFTVLWTASKYLAETDDRQRQTVDQAWQVVSAGQVQGGNGGRVQALEFLNKENQDLVGVDAPGAFLPKLDLEGAKLNWANFRDSALDGANLREAELWRANLRNVYLGPFVADEEDAESLGPLNIASISLLFDKEEDANRIANLEKSFLQGADLRMAYLVDASLREANVRFANLHGAVLDDAKLQQAKLEDASLQEASLVGAQLQGASLRGANLEDADIRGADLRGTKGLAPYQLEAAIGNGDTRLPKHIEQPSSWKQGTEVPLNSPQEPPLPSQEYSSKAFEPELSFSIGEGWRAYNNVPDELGLYTDYRSESMNSSITFSSARDVFDPSNPSFDPRRASLAKILPAPDNVARWLQEHPYLDTTDPVSIKIDGVTGVRMDMVVSSVPSDYPSDCPRPCIPVFRNSRGLPFAYWDGNKNRIMVLDVEGETVVISIESPANEADEFFRKAEKVVRTVEWRDD